MPCITSGTIRICKNIALSNETDTIWKEAESDEELLEVELLEKLASKSPIRRAWTVHTSKPYKKSLLTALYSSIDTSGS